MVVITAKKEVSAMQKLIQVSNAEVRQLQKQLADMERGSHTEIVKLRLEVSYVTLHMYAHMQYNGGRYSYGGGGPY